MPSGGFTGETSDLAVIDEHVRDAALVGLGEAGHGVRDFCTLKHRLFAHLVAEHDCCVFAIETHFSEALAINDYVLHGEGDAAAALDELEFWIWQTEAVHAFIEWMREFNRERPLADRIRFYGFDTQSTKAPADELTAFLDDVDPEFREEVDAGLAVARKGVKPADRAGNQDTSDEEVTDRIETVEETIADIATQFEDHRESYVAASSEQAMELAERHLRLLEQATELATLDRDAGQGIEYGTQRDEFMAENVAWIRERENSETLALWAADGHLRKGNDHHEDSVDGGPLGYHLHQQFGDDYCAFALEYGRGAVRTVDASDDAVSFPEQQLSEPPAGTVHALLESLTSSPAFLNLARTADDSGTAAWLTDRQTHCLAPIYDPERETGFETEYRIDLSWEFDGLFFVPTVTAIELHEVATSHLVDE